jgi:type VI secretion system protein ImpK
MSSEKDKTVFRPRTPRNVDQTIVRPTPGRRGGQTPSRPPVNNTFDNQTSPSGTSFETAYGLNPIVNSASTLIAVFEKTRKTLSHSDVAGLHQRLSNEIRIFQERLQKLEIKPEIAVSARYVLCSALDEIVLNTPWGAESHWPQKTLLSVFHNETSGGEKFFQILDHLRQTPSENRDMLELIYILISLGFEGRYRFADRGRDSLEQVRDELFSLIRSYRGEYERTLSPHCEGLGESRNSLTQYLPMWVVASVVSAIIVVSYSGFRYWLYEVSSPVVVELSAIVEADKPKAPN